MEDLQTLQKRIWEHYEKKVESSPAQADQPGQVNSGEREPSRTAINALNPLMSLAICGSRLDQVQKA
jgi:hypothetical protein